MAELNIILVTSEYRGDHAADVAVAIPPKPGETVEELVQRADLHPTDHLAIRIMREYPTPPPAPTPDPWDVPAPLTGDSHG